MQPGLPTAVTSRCGSTTSSLTQRCYSYRTGARAAGSRHCCRSTAAAQLAKRNTASLLRHVFQETPARDHPLLSPPTIRNLPGSHPPAGARLLQKTSSLFTSPLFQALSHPLGSVQGTSYPHRPPHPPTTMAEQQKGILEKAQEAASAAAQRVSEVGTWWGEGCAGLDKRPAAARLGPTLCLTTAPVTPAGRGLRPGEGWRGLGGHQGDRGRRQPAGQ